MAGIFIANMTWHFISFAVTESANSPAQRSDNGGQIVALPSGGTGGWTGLAVLDRDAIMSCLASALSGKQRLRWSINLPVTDHLHLRLNGESQLLSSRQPRTILALPQAQHRMLAEGNVISVTSLCHPALRERTLRRLSESGGLQALIDQWDHSSLEELEAFIDSYFEMVWDQTMGSLQSADPDSTAQEAVVEEAGQEEVLSSIDRKLSKLELLEDIRGDLAELRMSLEQSWKAIQEIRGQSKQDEDTG